MSGKLSREELAATGNPSCPEGDKGREMLDGMNCHHGDVTNWGLGFYTPPKMSNLLDIGCGGGATLARLLAKSPDAHVCGIDYSPLSVETSREYNSDAISEGKIEVVEGSVDDMPYTDNTFDMICSIESFYFWPTPQKSLKEVVRVLKKGGHALIICDTYNNGHLTETDRENIAKFSLYTPSLSTYRRLFYRAGFSKVILHTKKGTSWICAEGIK